MSDKEFKENHLSKKLAPVADDAKDVTEAVLNALPESIQNNPEIKMKITSLISERYVLSSTPAT